MKQAFDATGYTPIFTKIAVKPGKPTWFGRLGKQLILGLPGNPASANVCAHLCLKVLLGLCDTPHLIEAVVDRDLPKNGPRETYLRGALSFGNDGQMSVTPFPRQDSSLITPLAAANALVQLHHCAALCKCRFWRRLDLYGAADYVGDGLPPCPDYRAFSRSIIYRGGKIISGAKPRSRPNRNTPHANLGERYHWRLYWVLCGASRHRRRHIPCANSAYFTLGESQSDCGDVQPVHPRQFYRRDKLAGDALAFWPLLPAVFIGGFIGNHLGVFKLPELWLKRITGVLILAVALRLSLKWLILIA